MAPRYVPGRWVTPKTTPEWWRSGAYGTPRRKYERGHWVDPRTGAWVSKPGTTARTPGVTPPAPPVPSPPKPGGYVGLSEEELTRRANALADMQIGASSAAIERARAAAAAQAQRDAATYGALGQAQMGMIGQIPANIQRIQDTAGQAIAQYGNQVSAGQAQGLQAQQAAAAAFAASQGQAPTAPAADGAAAPVPNGPGPGAALGVDAQAAMAASAQMGGVLPAREQAEIGASAAAATAGMPAVVARATQDQVAMRMAQAATEDAQYRQQLIDLAATRGGVYADAYEQISSLENAKFGRWEAENRAKQDQEQFEYKKQQDQLAYKQWRDEMALKKRAQLASEVLTKIKTKAQADKEMRSWQLQQDKLAISQGYLDIATGKAGADYYTDAQGRTVPKGYRFNNAGELVRIPAPKTPKSQDANYYTDKQGRRVPKGYQYNAQGQLVKIPTSGPGSGKKGGGVKLANQLAGQFRGSPYRSGKDKNGNPITIRNQPKVAYASGVAQIRDALMGKGYPYAEADAIARNAMNAHYGPGIGGRPKK